MRYLIYNDEGAIAVFMHEQEADDYANDNNLSMKQIPVEDVHEYF